LHDAMRDRFLLARDMIAASTASALDSSLLCQPQRSLHSADPTFSREMIYLPRRNPHRDRECAYLRRGRMCENRRAKPLEGASLFIRAARRNTR
jgi:hypothetical protein